MKKFFVTFYLLLSLLICIGFEDSCKKEEVNILELWFPVGERVKYKLKWGFLTVGEAEFYSEEIFYEGQRYLLLTGMAKTIPFFSRIYFIKDTVQSLVDPSNFLPVKYIQKLYEGKKIRDDEIYFDRENLIATWYRKTKNIVYSIPIKEDTRDVLSLAFYLRSCKYDTGTVERFDVVVEDKIYNLELSVLNRETIEIKNIGKVRTLKIEPKAKFGEIFVRKGKVLLWFSDDNRHICVRMLAKLYFGAGYAELIEITGPGSEEWLRQWR